MSINSVTIVDDKWSKHLPDELIEKIVEQLGLFDSKAFSAVCSSWRIVAKAKAIAQIPCLLQCNSASGDSCYSVYSPSDNRAIDSFKFPKEIIDGGNVDMVPYCSGYVGSWLIMTVNKSSPGGPDIAQSYFFNPVSAARIALPPHTHTDKSFFVRDDRTDRNEKLFIKTVASSDPSDSNCIVAAITLHGYKVAFCRPNDTHWTLQYRPHTPKRGGFGFTDLQFHNGKLYVAVGRMIDAGLLEFDPVEVLSGSQCSSGSYKGKVMFLDSVSFHIRKYTYCIRNMSFTLITSFTGEMLLIVKMETIGNHREVSFLVSKAEIRGGGCGWEKMNSLKDEAIFIGDIGARTLVAMSSKPTNSTMPAVEKLGGRNCIYFCNEKDDEIGVYNLVDGTVKFQSTGDLQKGHTKCWFTPA